MSTISVPLSSENEAFIDSFIESGKAENKAQVVRRALVRLAEEEAINDVLEATREIESGKGLRGDLRTLLKKI